MQGEYGFINGIACLYEQLFHFFIGFKQNEEVIFGYI